MKTFVEFISALLSFLAVVFLIAGGYFVYTYELAIEYKIACGLVIVFFAAIGEGIALLLNRVWR